MGACDPEISSLMSTAAKSDISAKRSGQEFLIDPDVNLDLHGCTHVSLPREHTAGVF